MGLISGIIRGVKSLLGSSGAQSKAAATVSDIGGRVKNTDKINAVFDARTWSEPFGDQPPEAGFSYDEWATVEDSVFDTRLIQEFTGAVKSRGNPDRQITKVQANRDVINRPDDYDDSADLLFARWAEPKSDRTGTASVEAGGRFRENVAMFEAKGLDTNSPSIREWDIQ